jgi:hypothetical protein
MMKFCRKCGAVKPRGEFHVKSAAKDGLDGSCKDCTNAYKAKYYKSLNAEPRKGTCTHCGEEFLLLTKKRKFCSRNCYSNYYSTSVKRQIWEDKNLLTKMVYRIKHRAKKLGIEFDIEPGDLEVPEVCPVLGIPIMFNRGKGYSPTSPSVDRINPNKGYIKSNVRVISARANLLKSNATVEELTKVLEDIKKIKDYPETTLLSESEYPKTGGEDF